MAHGDKLHKPVDPWIATRIGKPFPPPDQCKACGQSYYGDHTCEKERPNEEKPHAG